MRERTPQPRELFESTILAASGLSFEQFEQEWQAYIRQLYAGLRDPVAQARGAVARGQQFAATGQKPSAREAFEDALRWDPENLEAMLGLAGLQGRTKDKAEMDASLLWARRALSLAGQSGAQQAEAEARKLADAVDPAGRKRLFDAENDHRQGVQREIDRHLSQGRPKTALALALRCLDGVLGDDAFAPLAQRLEQEGTVELMRRRRPFDGRTLMGLVASSAAFRVADGVFEGAVEHPRRGTLQVEDPIAPRYRLEGELEVASIDTVVCLYQTGSGGSTIAGFVMRPSQPPPEKPLPAPAAPADGPPVEGDPGPPPVMIPAYLPFDLVPHGQVGRLGFGYDERTRRSDFLVSAFAPSTALPAPGKWVRFALDRSEPGRLRLELDGITVAEQPSEPGRGELHPALLVFDGGVRIRDLSIQEFDRF